MLPVDAPERGEIRSGGQHDLGDLRKKERKNERKKGRKNERKKVRKKVRKKERNVCIKTRQQHTRYTRQ